jgi:hypothetical protein
VTSLANTATSKLVTFLSAPTGVNANIAALQQSENVALALIAAKSFFTENVSSDIAEKSLEYKYAAVYIYCGKIVNSLKEKFRTFSGVIQMEIDVRVSQDRLEGIDRKSQLYTDAVSQTLNQNRGDWGQGIFYPGGYEISFGSVKHGGRNFIKSAKISLDLDASVD